MKLSKNNQKIIDTLRDKKLVRLIKPFLKMIELEKLKEIVIHKMTWKVIMREIYNEHNTKSDIEKMMISYFVLYNILAPKKKTVDKRESKERVAKHRADRKASGFKTISVQLYPYDFERLKEFKEDFDLTYTEAISKLLEKAPRRRK